MLEKEFQKDYIKKCVVVVGERSVSKIISKSNGELKMPVLTLSTNVSLNDLDASSILSQVISTVASIMRTPEPVSLLSPLSL